MSAPQVPDKERAKKASAVLNALIESFLATLTPMERARRLRKLREVVAKIKERRWGH